MKIKNLDGLSSQDMLMELDRGGKFVVYQYCISIIVMTFRRSSDIYFIRAGESGVVHGLGFTILTLILGWWGIPWGPIYTIGSVFNNLSGGKNITNEVLAALTANVAQKNE